MGDCFSAVPFPGASVGLFSSSLAVVLSITAAEHVSRQHTLFFVYDRLLGGALEELEDVVVQDALPMLPLGSALRDGGVEVDRRGPD